MSSVEPIMRDVSDAVEPDVLKDSISYRIRLLQIAAYKLFEKRITEFGVAPRYFGMLKLIEANPGIPQMRLAELIFLDRSSLVPILETLSREGWIERKGSPQDKRVKRVFLTESGTSRLALLERQVVEHEESVSKSLTEAEKAILIMLLDKLGVGLRELQESE